MPARSLCVYCHKRPEEDPYRPFCSERCKQADLGHWLSGDYRIASQPASSDEPDDAPTDGTPDDPTRHHQ